MKYGRDYPKIFEEWIFINVCVGGGEDEEEATEGEKVGKSREKRGEEERGGERKRWKQWPVNATSPGNDLAVTQHNASIPRIKPKAKSDIQPLGKSDPIQIMNMTHSCHES